MSSLGYAKVFAGKTGKCSKIEQELVINFLYNYHHRAGALCIHAISK